MSDEFAGSRFKVKGSDGQRRVLNLDPDTEPSPIVNRQSSSPRRLARLRRRLDALLPVREVTVPLPRAEKDYRILAPADTDRLLDAAESDPEQHLPYWAEIWPSGI